MLQLLQSDQAYSGAGVGAMFGLGVAVDEATAFLLGVVVGGVVITAGFVVVALFDPFFEEKLPQL